MRRFILLVQIACCVAACLAQMQGEGSIRTFTVTVPVAQTVPAPPGDSGHVPLIQVGCTAVPVSDTPSVPERAMFNVTTKLMELDKWLPSTGNSTEDLDELLSGPCGLGAVWQSHPLYPEDFMLYYARPTQQLDQLPTDCISMITEETKQLDVIEWYQQPFLAPVLGNDSDPMNTVYPVCSDTQWEHTDWFSKYTVGPVQTWLLFYNSCPLQEANVRVSIERMDGSAEEYCDELTTRNSGQYRLWTLMRLMYFGAFMLAALALLVVSGFCTCWCRLPLAVPACRRVAEKPLQSALESYRGFLDRLGLGWLSGREIALHAGDAVYAHRGGRYGIAYELLLCSLLLTVLAAYSHVAVPIYWHTDSAGTGSNRWSITDSVFKGSVEGPSLIFTLALLVSAAYSFVAFMVAVVHFSDPLVDPRFHNKLAVLGFCMLVLQLPLIAVRIDLWMNVRLWKYPASQIILQGATTIMIVLTDAAFVLVLVRVHRLIWRHDLHMRRNPSATQRIGKARYMIEDLSPRKPPKRESMEKQTSKASHATTRTHASTNTPTAPVSVATASPAHSFMSQENPLSSKLPPVSPSQNRNRNENRASAYADTTGDRNNTTAAEQNQNSGSKVPKGLASVSFSRAAGPVVEGVEGVSHSYSAPSLSVAMRGSDAGEAMQMHGADASENVGQGASAGMAVDEKSDRESFDEWMPQQLTRLPRYSGQPSSMHSGVGDPVSTVHGLAAGNESDHGGWKRRTVLQTLQAVNALNGIETETDNMADDSRDPSRSFFDIRGHMHAAWQAVCPTETFQYSTFFMAALIVTAVILTYSFVNAIYRIKDLADCLRDGNTCFQRTQRWVLQNVVAGLPGVLYLPEKSTAACTAAGLLAPELGGDSTSSVLADSLAQECAVLEQAMEALQALRPMQLPAWLEEARAPLIIGGAIGFSLAYMLGLYTIVHVAAAYKRFSRQIIVANVVESLTKRSLQRPKDFGTSLISDYKQVHIGQSAYFMGMLVSTCWLQLWWAGSLCTIIITTLLHSHFWVRLLSEQWGWVISIAAVSLWHICSQAVINRFVVSGAQIKHPFVWVFVYISCSTLYAVVAILLAAMRVLLLLGTTVIALSRLDKCIFTIAKRSDNGYKSFLAMTLMLHAVKHQTAPADAPPSMHSTHAQHAKHASTAQHSIKMPESV